MKKRTTKRRSKNNRRDPLLEQTLMLIEEGEVSVSHISQKSGLSRSTISNWLNGKTQRPQAISLQFALAPLGYELTVRKKGR